MNRACTESAALQTQKITGTRRLWLYTIKKAELSISTTSLRSGFQCHLKIQHTTKTLSYLLFGFPSPRDFSGARASELSIRFAADKRPTDFSADSLVSELTVCNPCVSGGQPISG